MWKKWYVTFSKTIQLRLSSEPSFVHFFLLKEFLMLTDIHSFLQVYYLAGCHKDFFSKGITNDAC
jgi:hypothetical protein